MILFPRTTIQKHGPETFVNFESCGSGYPMWESIYNRSPHMSVVIMGAAWFTEACWTFIVWMVWI